MPTQNQQIMHEVPEHKYFTMMLNMADDDLNLHQYRLLGHYLRWAGHGGTAPEGIQETARICHMGKDKVRSTRKELEALGYLKIKEPTEEECAQGKATEITVLDRWAENIARYMKPVANQVQGSTQSGTPPIPTQVHPPIPNEVDSEEHTEKLKNKEKESFAADAAPDLQIQQPSMSSAFEEAIEELDMPDTPAAPQREWVAVDESDFDPKPQLQECTSKDIVAMLHAYYIWCPPDKLPVKYGRLVEFSNGVVNIPTNREFAESQFQRGMVPSDYIEFLSNLRHFLKVESADRYERMARNLNVEERLAFKWLKNLEQQKSLTFCYLAPIVEEWVAAGRDWYTDECPRVVHRHPDVTPRIVVGDDERDNPDLIVDVPPRYVSPHAAAGLDDDDDDEFDTEAEPDEMDNWTPADWEREGMPL